jgi:L-serine dehydratase
VDAISTFDVFKIGVGPSSSHTMGPWRAAGLFLSCCREAGVLSQIRRVRIDLYGSLAKTGRGHGTDLAVLMGLEGRDPETCDTAGLHGCMSAICSQKKIHLAGGPVVTFQPIDDLVFHPTQTLPFHPNGLTFTAWYDDAMLSETYYSVGGGFVVQEGASALASSGPELPLPFETASELLGHCREQRSTIAEVVRRNEAVWRTSEQVSAGLARIWTTMRACVYRGCHTAGTLPGGLGVARRAAGMARHLLGERDSATVDTWFDLVKQRGSGFQNTLRWVSCFALAVNEENAAFGRVVTAPTNGAAGVIPAVLLYLDSFIGADATRIEDFLLTAGAVGVLFKKRATISAALGGCQAEIGVSSAMAAAGLTACQDGSSERALMAAEIAMEHHLGLTCDPVGGLVQVPCIERNTMGAVKAITATGIALDSDPSRAKVSLDTVIQSMWETALDMNTKYKETAEGGLALHIAVNVSEC